jgi:very-short-patch-repair endonuclease
MTREANERTMAVARGQHGVVTHEQLRAAGLSSGAIKRRARAGGLQRLHRGVYLVGAVPPPMAAEMAAVLAYGPGATLSHGSAAALRGLRPAHEPAAPIDVSIPGRSRVARAGVRLWQARCFEADERSPIQGMPVASVGRTIVDLAAVVGIVELERMVARAERERLIDPAGLDRLLARYRGRPGLPALRQVLGVRGGPCLTRSEAEARFLALVREARLPTPMVNAMVEGCELDFLWPDERIAVEVDGYRFHGNRLRFEGDRRRATGLAARGIQVIPLTWRQIVEDRVATAVQVGQALVQARRGRDPLPRRSR